MKCKVKVVSIAEYNKKMKKVMDDTKHKPVHETLIDLMYEASKYEIREDVQDAKTNT